MRIANLEIGLRKMMTAAFRAKGLSEEAADTKATSNMEAAIEYFHSRHAEALSPARISESQEMLKEQRGRGVMSTEAQKAAHATARRERGQMRLARGGLDRSHSEASAVGVAMRGMAMWAKTLP